MKKKLFIIGLLFPIFGFSYEVNFNKSFSKVVNPDLLTTNITINIEKKDENKVNSEIEKFNALPDTSSHLYPAIRGRLAAVICIKDPVREEAAKVVSELHSLGIKKVVMMTGDSRRNAERVAREIGIDEVHAEVLPGDKAASVFYRS